MDELPIKRRAEPHRRPLRHPGREGREAPALGGGPVGPLRPGRGGAQAAAAVPGPRRCPGRGGRQADHSSPTSDPLSAWRAGKVRAGRIGGPRAAQEDEASMTGDEWSAPRPGAGPGDAGPGDAARCRTWRRGTWRRGPDAGPGDAGPGTAARRGTWRCRTWHRGPMQDLTTRDLPTRDLDDRAACLTNPGITASRLAPGPPCGPCASARPPCARLPRGRRRRPSSR